MQGPDFGPQRESHTELHQSSLETDAEAIAIADLLAARVDPADQPAPRRDPASPKRRLQLEACRSLQRVLLTAERALVIDQPPRALETLRVRKNDQLAVGGVTEFDLLAVHESMHQAAAVERQREQPARRQVALRPVAREDEFEQPAPLVWIELRVETKRGVAPQQPGRDLREHAGSGERRHVAVRELGAVGEARLQRDAIVAIDDGDAMPVLGQVVGGGEADHAGAKDDDVHRARLPRNAVDADGSHPFEDGVALAQRQRQARWSILHGVRQHARPVPANRAAHARPAQGIPVRHAIACSPRPPSGRPRSRGPAPSAPDTQARPAVQAART